LVLVSACLCGIHCRYDARSKPVKRFREMLAGGECLPFCPEQLGMLTTPREPAEIVGGDGFDVLDGRARVLLRDRPGDVTHAFLLGAERSLQIASACSPEMVFLKERSPSCALHDGPGHPGVATAALMRAGWCLRAVDGG
jgi:uncharacterized protein YbbK (DUF523 family)